MRTLSQLAKEALEIQDASNLSGVVHAFSRAMIHLRMLMDGAGTTSTEALNQHPIAVLYSSKIASLTGSENGLAFTKAYEKVKKIVACNLSIPQKKLLKAEGLKAVGDSAIGKIVEFTPRGELNVASMTFKHKGRSFHVECVFGNCYRIVRTT